MPPSSGLDPTAPFPFHSIDSEYYIKPLAQQGFSLPQTNLQAFSVQNGLNGQICVSPIPAVSDMESRLPAPLAGQPLLYVPSTSLLMLCGSLQEGPSPGSERDSRHSEVSAAAEQPSVPSVQKRFSEERKPQGDEEPASKRQSRDYEDGPLSLVMPKVRELARCVY